MSKPNVLMITVHDIGNYLGCYGYSDVPSPNLDRIAAEGVRFENHFTTGVLCSPSRGSIQTALHPHVNGLEGLTHRGWSMKPHIKTIPQRLKGTDYTSVLIGYQHEADRANVESLGYDLHVATDVSRAKDVIPEAEKFFASQAKEIKPWFASLGVFEVHNPYDDYESVDPDGVEIPPYAPQTPEAKKDVAAFQGAIKHWDDHVGRILDALDANGLSENTLVVFTSDHGPAWPRAKVTTYDPGLRCALLMRHPTMIKAGSTIDAMTSHVDISPSLLDLMGLPVPIDVEGMSFANAVRGGDFTPRERVFAEDLATRTIRTEKFKYIKNFKNDLPVTVAGWQRDADYAHKFADEWSPLPPEELYDLENDPLERNNLIDDERFQSIRLELNDKLFEWLEKTNDRILEGRIPEKTYAPF